MKWALLVLACVSLFVCREVGRLSRTVEARHGYMNENSSAAAAAAISAGYTGGAIGAGLLGAASALGAALIQASENKKKD